MFSGHVPVAAGDEALDALDVPGAVGLLVGDGTTGADVGAGVGLGEHHRGTPLPVDHGLGERPAARGCRAGR